MKKLLPLFIAFLINVPFNTYSYPHDNISISLTETDPEYRDKPSKGHRMPSTPETCVIDFVNLTIHTERIPMVISYELWDEAGETTVASYSTDFELVTLMSSLTGCYQLRLVTEECTYTGYLEL